MASVGLHAGEESPSWRLSAQTAADSVQHTRPRLSETRGRQGPARTCQPGQEACGPSGGGFLHGLPCVTPAACSAVAGRAARKGARGSKIGCGSESGLSTRPCRLAGFLRFPHRFTPRVPSGLAGWPAQSPLPFTVGSHPPSGHHTTQPPTIKSAPGWPVTRLARLARPASLANPRPPDGARSSCDHRCRPHIRKIGEHYAGGTTTSFPGAGPQFPRGKEGDSAC